MMAVISLVNAKGGVGKTTLGMLLSTELAHQGAKIALIDADPLHWLTRWMNIDGGTENITSRQATQSDVIEEIERASSECHFVIVDCEGTSSVTSGYAVALSDLILTPIQPSSLDAEGAGEAFKMVSNQSKLLKKRLDHWAVLNRTSAAIRTREQKALEAQLNETGVRVLQTRLVERAAFKAPFAYGGGLRQLDPKEVSNVDKAINNAQAFTSEVLDILEGSINAKS